MPARHWLGTSRRLLFVLALLAAAWPREGDSHVVRQAILWLPSGVAVAGLWLLGLSNWWIVVLCTLLQRLLLGYGITVALPAVAGSTAEAILGVLVLRRLGFQATVARLRDVLAVCVAAAAAPLASIAFSWLGRLYVWSDPGMPFYSGWDGWWRMNALGILTVVPPALLWLGAPWPSPRRKFVLSAAAASVGIVVLLSWFVTIVPVNTTGVMLLNLALLPSLYSAVRGGPRGAATAGALSATLVAVATVHAVGPFLAVDPAHRHTAVQLFELFLVTVPLVFGALIAERETARVRSQQSESLRQAIQRALPDLTYRLNRSGVCTDIYVPAGMAGAVREHEVVGLHLSEFLPAEAARLLERSIARVLEERNLQTVEYPRLVDGHLRIREARCVPYGAEDILALERDITDRKLYERSKTFEARVLELVATGSPSAQVYAAIVGGIEALVQDGLCSVALLDGARLRIVAAPSLPAGYRAAVDGLEVGAAIASWGASPKGQPTAEPADGTNPLWTACREVATSLGLHPCTSVPIREPGGLVLGVFIVHCRRPRDLEPHERALAEAAGMICGIVLERERLEEQFRQSQKMEALGKLAGGIAHDFNNLLTAMFGYGEAIRAAVAPDSPLRAHIDEVLAASQRAAGLTRQLLAYSRQQVLSPHVLDLPVVVEQLSAMLRRVIGEDIELTTRSAGGPGRVRVDRSQLEQVILNLVVNARDAMPSGGTLTITTSCEDVNPTFALGHGDLHAGPYVALAVQDTGAGMPPDVQTRAFDPFFTTKERGKGTGLGLSTVYGIVKQSGGAIWLESEPGAGTTAWIYLPRVEAPVDDWVPRALPAPASRDALVLVVEDEEVVRDLVRQILAGAGFQVLEACDGEDALRVVRATSTQIDLLVTDIVMPHLGGWELASSLRAQRPDLRVLFMSGYPSDARNIPERDRHGMHFLQKPFRPHELIERVRALLPVRQP